MIAGQKVQRFCKFNECYNFGFWTAFGASWVVFYLTSSFIKALIIILSAPVSLLGSSYYSVYIFLIFAFVLQAQPIFLI